MTDDSATAGFVMNQTMLRVRDPGISVAFYRDVLGMTELARYDFEEMRFSLYFMGYLADGEQIPEEVGERAEWLFARPALVELTHNWGTESDAEFDGYHDGNAPPQGFGHIGISVPDVHAACERFEHLGIEFVKRPDDGKMKGSRVHQGP